LAASGALSEIPQIDEARHHSRATSVETCLASEIVCGGRRPGLNEVPQGEIVPLDSIEGNRKPETLCELKQNRGLDL
jgi:hypothetical protein